MATFGGFGGAAGGGGGFTFGNQKTTASSLTFPAQTAATTAGSLGFSLTPQTTATTTPSLNISFPAKTTAPTLGIAPATTASGGFALGGTTTTAGGGLTLGGTTTASGGFTLGGATKSAGGFSFGLTPASSVTTTAPGLSLGTTPSTTGGGLTGIGFGSTTSAAAPTLGFSGGGLLGAAATTTTGSSIFSNVTTTTSVTGLGGVDPKTSTSGTGASTASGSSSDGKLLKENHIPDPLVVTVDELQKYVKDEKTVREDIVRMSSKPMMRVQEDIAALKQLLSVVSNGLQRNACTLDKLKTEMTQELKNAEMAQRTKDIPPGLQYENTAPTEYFEQLLDDFENRMVAYRQQIEMLENHLATLHQPLRHSPSELFVLISKLHETFIALAAQLQLVHEKIKSQKEQFLTYRRVFHGDTKDIFQPTVQASSRPIQRRPLETSGPTPFPGITNTAAAAMASVMNRSQQPHGPPVAGLLGATGASSWLTSGGAGLSSTGLLAPGTTLLGQPVAQASSHGVGSSMFSLGTGLGAAGPANSNNNSLASTLGSLNNTANASLNMSAATKQPFTLQKPPQGAKRGKR